MHNDDEDRSKKYWCSYDGDCDGDDGWNKNNRFNIRNNHDHIRKQQQQ